MKVAETRRVTSTAVHDVGLEVCAGTVAAIKPLSAIGGADEAPASRPAERKPALCAVHAAIATRSRKREVGLTAVGRVRVAVGAPIVTCEIARPFVAQRRPTVGRARDVAAPTVLGVGEHIEVLVYPAVAVVVDGIASFGFRGARVRIDPTGLASTSVRRP